MRATKLIMRMKKLLSRTIPLILILLAIPLSASAYDFKVGGIYYIILEDGKSVAVTDKSLDDNSYSGSVEIPSQVTYSGTTYSVTLIDAYAFSECTDLTSVTIPYSVTKIGYGAFQYCTGLTSVTIPNGVRKIDGYAFNSCMGLTSVTIPYSVTSIGEFAFGNCLSLTSLTFNAWGKLWWIGEYAFRECALTSVTIPYYVTEIGESAFDDCFFLTSVIYNAKECSVSEGWLSGCSNITSFEIGNVVESIPSNLCEGLTGLTSVTYNAQECSVSEGWLSGCSNITSFVIGNHVESIPSHLCEGLTGLTSLTIPNSVTTIGEKAFYDCTGLTSVVVPNSVSSIGYQAFHICNNAKIKAFPQPYSQLKDGWSSDDGTLVLVGGRLYDYSTVDTHQESIDFVIEALDYEPAPEGYESIEAYEGGIYYNGNYYQANSGETLTFNNLKANEEFTFQRYTKYHNGESIFFKEEKLTTCGLGVNVDNTYSATIISAEGSYKLDDAVFDSEYITFNGDKIEGHKLLATGLKPNTSYEASYTVCTKGGSIETKNFDFMTPELELTILKPNSVSSSSTIVAAETNMSDDEISAGFQWKKNDAPSTLEPNEAYAAIYDGRLEGYIKNLQSTSFYDVRAFYKAADGTYYYSDWKTFDPSDFSYFEPTVHTYPTSEVTANSATVKGYVLPGSDEIINQGIEYWENDNATASKKVLSDTADDNGVNTIFANGQVMLVTLSDLNPATTYSYRAFVTTQAGVTYGEEQSFTTMGEAGIGSVGVDSPERVVIGYFDLSGRRYENPQRGLNIVVYSDGSTEKVIVKQ